VVRRAKAAYWRNQIESASDDKALYRIMGWERKTSQFKPPALEDNGNYISDPHEKAEFLRRSLLKQQPATPDLTEDELDYTVVHGIHWDHHISLGEAREATISVGNTTPGADGITVNMIRAAWNSIGPYVRLLYQRCMDLGEHPEQNNYQSKSRILGPTLD
jgi:hypothetical protein